MTARSLLVLFMVIGIIYDLITMYIAARQRKKPLPPEVADVYDADRYQQYLSYVADHRKSALIVSGVSFIATTALYYADIYPSLEAAFNGNPYLIFIATMLIFGIVSTVIDVIDSYYTTFFIRERYGLNRQDRKGFIRDTALDILQGTVITLALGMILVFIGEHMAKWTNGFSVSLPAALLIAVAIAAVIAVFVIGASFFSIWILKKQYTFTPLPEGDLRTKVMALQAGAKKQVRIINVYDESKKSTSKNAFLLKFLWHREFGIADNFLNGNAEDELLAVLSHEIGHLKHKKNLLNWLGYAFLGALFCLFVLVVHRPGAILNVNAWIRASFNTRANNYCLLIAVYSACFTPLGKAIGIFNNYRSRCEEYEADREAVKNGYGEALITTFKRLSSDELVNVNPHPIIEFLEYNHPGMYQRIKAIRAAERA